MRLHAEASQSRRHSKHDLQFAEQQLLSSNANFVSFIDATNYAAWLSKKEQKQYLLPTFRNYQQIFGAFSDPSLSGDENRESMARRLEAIGVFDLFDETQELCDTWYRSDRPSRFLNYDGWVAKTKSEVEGGLFLLKHDGQHFCVGANNTGFRLVLVPSDEGDGS
jgi:formylglycine-generating enzyme required for sulfatase activity